MSAQHGGMRPIDAGMLVLEPQTAAHADEMFGVLCDPAIYEHENAPPPSLDWLRTRFARLESRASSDGREQWLNWVIRIRSSVLGCAPHAQVSAAPLPPAGAEFDPRDGPSRLIGYVQATVRADHRAAIAYELASAYWGRGLAHRAVEAMIGELVSRYGVTLLTAVLKRTNLRSRRLLERLAFTPGVPEILGVNEIEADEILMYRGTGTVPARSDDRPR